MNVTFVPAQIVVPGLAAMLTDGATVELTAIVIVLDVAVVGVAQASDDVITTLTWSVFAKELFE